MSAEHDDLHRTAGPSMTRRTMLKTTAGAGAATLGMGAADQLGVEPVGDADAAFITTAIVGGSVIAASATAGAYIWENHLESHEVDESNVTGTQIYNAANAATNGRQAFVNEMNGIWGNAADGNSPFAANAWSEVRVAVVDEFVNDGSESDAVAAAKKQLDKTATRGIINMVERWNTGLKGISTAVSLEYENNAQQLYLDASNSKLYLGDSLSGGWTSTTDMPDPFFKSPILDETYLPMDPMELDNVEEPRRMWALAIDTATPFAPTASSRFDFMGSAHDQPLMVNHPDLAKKTVLDATTYGAPISQIFTEYNSISSDLSTFVSNFWQGLKEGAIAPSQYLSGRDLIREVSGSSQQSQLAAQLAASGIPVPEDAGMQAKISHPDLYSDALWGYFYPLFSVDPAPSLKPDMTIPASDYDMVYFGYTDQQDGEFTVDVLPSSAGDITIHDIADLDDEQEVDENRHADSADSDGGVVVWDGGEDGETPPPDAIRYGRDGWSLVVDGATGPMAIDPSKVQKNEETGEWYIPSDVSDLAPGEGVEGIRLQPNADYETTTDPVADPSNIDSENQTAMIERTNQLIEDLREEFESSGPGGFGFDLGGIPTIPGLGAVGTIAVAIGGIFGLQALSS